MASEPSLRHFHQIFGFESDVLHLHFDHFVAILYVSREVVVWFIHNLLDNCEGPLVRDASIGEILA